MKNYSHTYVMPIMSQWINLSEKYQKNIINTYLFSNREMSIGKFYIECNFNYKNVNFSEDEKTFTDNEVYYKSYSVENNVLYEYNIPKEYHKDILHFVNGEYSKLSKDYKMQVKKYWIELYGNTPNFITTTIRSFEDIFNKTDSYRLRMEKDLNIKIKPGSELGSKIDIEEETFEFKEDNKITLENISNIF